MVQVDQGELSVVTINRPEQMNAIDLPMLLELEEIFKRLEDDDEVRVVIFTGAGSKAFVAGGDIDDLRSRAGLAHYTEFAEVVHRLYRQFDAYSKPTIAAVNGYALGGGVEIMLSMDLRLVADTAKLGLPEIKLGLFPGAGGTQRLLRQVPLCRAKELMFTGEMITAHEAVAMGLANRVVPAESLLAEARALGQRIAERSPIALRLLKRTMYEGASMPLPGALAYEQAMIGLALDSADAHEGCNAFVEKRRPRFIGR